MIGVIGVCFIPVRRPAPKAMILHHDIDKLPASALKMAQFRNTYPVTNICMHGRSLSRHDNRELWKTYDYRDLGIIGEPNFDVDYTKVFYITDTGRKWNNEAASIRDKVKSGFDIPIKISGKDAKTPE